MTQNTILDMSVAVVIPCYKVRKHVLNVIHRIGPEVRAIYAVDDACPEQSGQFIEQTCQDPRVKVLYNDINKGVGGAVITGYRAALADGMEIVVKIDGDGQMAPELLPNFITPILDRQADYTKGNRFYSFYNVRSMPRLRLWGNAVLSFMTKISSGYWNTFDPTNGYTAIHRSVLARIDLKNVSERYFFESDMLVKLGAERAVVIDIPMEAIYADEESNLHVAKIVPEFFKKHCFESVKRLIYTYLIRDFSLASVNLILGMLLMVFGTVFGALKWVESITSGHVASAGTVILSALPIMLGFQLLLSFLAYDIANQPRIPLSRLLMHDHKQS